MSCFFIRLRHLGPAKDRSARHRLPLSSLASNSPACPTLPAVASLPPYNHHHPCLPHSPPPPPASAPVPPPRSRPTPIRPASTTRAMDLKARRSSGSQPSLVRPVPWPPFHPLFPLDPTFPIPQETDAVVHAGENSPEQAHSRFPRGVGVLHLVRFSITIIPHPSPRINSSPDEPKAPLNPIHRRRRMVEPFDRPPPGREDCR